MNQYARDTDWTPGLPDRVRIDGAEKTAFYRRDGGDLWLLYLSEVLVTEATPRSIEKFGVAVVLEHRPDLRFDEDGEAAILSIDLSPHEAEQLLDDVLVRHGEPEYLEVILSGAQELNEHPLRD
ncbi:hypothetical protein G3I44_14090 [Halogeometricum borinquense]|uniref:Uncharacterized protein n=1 Tax=Halogeometricum borinquense TaxID=60847 RepID=A0A6C0UJC4_9EURY|nr:hypothetical protein [Halogeometricum borinquense]QIB75317.1 hypothetical protein G3I44_14090 [Halogeometricum borinquense]